MKAFFALIALVTIVSCQRYLSDTEWSSLGLTLDLEQVGDKLVHGQTFPMRATLTNNGNKAVGVVIDDTPFSKHPDDDFIVTKPDTSIYMDVIASKVHDKVDRDDVYWLQPGTSIQRVFDLEKLRHFTQATTYETYVMFDLVFFLKQSHKYYFRNAMQHDINSNFINVEVTSVQRLEMDEFTSQYFTLSDSTKKFYMGTEEDQCTSSQQQIVIQALKKADAWTQKGYNSYRYSSQAPQLRTWFGTSSSSTLRSNLKKLQDVYRTYDLSFACGGSSCSPNTYAYVYPNDSKHIIHLCGVFWRANDDRTYDSKAGTIIHETAHFKDVIGTGDYVYGQSGAKQLAASNSATAMKNSDNNEYFQENTVSNWNKY